MRRAHDAEDALADGAHITPRTVFLEIHIDKNHPDRVDLAKVLSGQRAKTLFQAALQPTLTLALALTLTPTLTLTLSLTLSLFQAALQPTLTLTLTPTLTLTLSQP